MDAADGDDYISNKGDKSSLVGGKGNDSIYNTGDHATINAGYFDEEDSLASDDDYVRNTGEYASIVTGFGNDTVLNTTAGKEVTIDSGAGDDSINNLSEDGSAFIFAGDGDNYINNNASQSKITAGTGNDTIYNNYDFPVNGLKRSTISVEGGNNYIENKAVKSSIYTGDGDDTIKNFSNEDSAKIIAGNGNNTIENYSSSSTIIAGDGKDTIHNFSIEDGVSIDSGADDDIIINNASAPTIIAGDGNDSIVNHYSKKNPDGKASISAGAGDDTVRFDYAAKATIDPGTGNDIVTLSSTGHNNTVIIDDYGGASHNVIYGWQTLSGNDFVVTGGANYDTYAVGRDRRDLLVTLESGDFTVFVDVLTPTPAFSSLRAVVIDDSTPNNDKLKVTANSLGKYKLDNETVVMGSFNKDTVKSLEHFESLFIRGEEDKVSMLGEEESSFGYSVTDSLTIGIGTIVGSNYDSLGSNDMRGTTGKTLYTRDNITKMARSATPITARSTLPSTVPSNATSSPKTSIPSTAPKTSSSKATKLITSSSAARAPIPSTAASVMIPLRAARAIIPPPTTTSPPPTISPN